MSIFLLISVWLLDYKSKKLKLKATLFNFFLSLQPFPSQLQLFENHPEIYP